MKTVTVFPRQIVEHEDMGIPMPDGCRLSARIWLPVDAAESPVPAILEHLPYRKRDGTTARDSLTHPYMAGHGYACVRVDMRGNGDSEGLMDDEYTAQELHDACDVIAWLAAQPWCNGKVGMQGISWGGFNSLQVAALRPPALKAIVTMCSTDDRYADDIHYKGGLLLNENLGWGATMFSFTPRPPDPALVGDKWRSMWLDRLEANEMLHARWLEHQARDAYWKHGSVCEDYSAIEAAVLAVGGWGDAYKNTVSRLVENLEAPAKGIVGPWIHKYPHFARPNPIGFLQEMRRWWDHWLKGIDNGVEDDPAMRIFAMDSERPYPWYETRTGRWIAETSWPSPRVRPETLHLTGESSLAVRKPSDFSIPVASPADTGLHGGEYCAIYWGPELPGDQRRDDALSACFDGAPLESDLTIVGGPEIALTLSSDKPVAQVAVRLDDVYPDGASTRITYGVLNLCHRNGHERPEKLVPGERFEIRLRLDDIAWRVPAGNRLRIAISTAYWPMVWPSPEPVTLTLFSGALTLPVHDGGDADEWSFEEPEAAEPWAIRELRPTDSRRVIHHDQVTGAVTVEITDDFGEAEDLAHGLKAGSSASETWSIHPDDPLSARGECVWIQTSGRGEWSTRTEAVTAMRADRDSFRITGHLRAWEGDALIFERQFNKTVDRGCL